jgi:preprotein translocase subunit SecG
MGIAFTLLTVLFIVVSVALVLVILVQRPQGGGLASAFGGGGGTDTAFGGRTGDALTVATVAVFSVYLLLAIGLNIFNRAPAKEEAPTAVSETAPAAPATQEVPMTPIQMPADQPAAAQPETVAPSAAPAPAPAPAAATVPSTPAAAPAPAPAADPAPAAAPKA